MKHWIKFATSVQDLAILILLHIKSSSFSSIEKDEPYGPDVPIKKLECVGRVQKRLGTALRKLKTTKSRTPLADGKSIGGRG